MRLNPTHVLAGYSQGVFPMAHDNEIYWYDPNPRGIIPLDGFNVPKSLRRALRKADFTITVDTQFEATMRACARSAPGRETTWISEEFIQIYGELHRHGFAHSVETWHDGAMVGGLYGVALGGLFAGESMWSTATNASKAALVALVERLRSGGFVLLDTQWTTDHLKQFGAIDISRAEYKQRLAQALTVTATF